MSPRKPGRVSSAALAIRPVTLTERLPPPPPPSHLTDDQAAIWRETIAQLPAGRVPPEALGLLEQYCRHLDIARRIAQVRNLVDSKIDESATDDTEWMKSEIATGTTLDKLEKRLTRQSAILASIAMKLRITPGAMRRAEQVEAETADLKPWEDA